MIEYNFIKKVIKVKDKNIIMIKDRNIFQKVYDYIWFHWYLDGDEFNSKLNYNEKNKKNLIKKRDKAHKLDIYYDSIER